MKKKANIILTGFMGTGKSTVGKKIADRLGWPFIDTDDLIEEKAGMIVSNIFAKHGEAYFRTLERQVIDNVCRGTGKVVATGGGAMTIEENARRLQESGTVICLTAEPEVILSRVQDNVDRPLLQGADPLGKIRTLLSARAEAYARADIIIDTSHLDIDETVAVICSRLETDLRI